jgi:hypothetical protein
MMSADSLHKILEPYLAAIALLTLVLCATAILLKRHGDHARRASEAEKREEDRRETLF